LFIVLFDAQDLFPLNLSQSAISAQLPKFQQFCLAWEGEGGIHRCRVNLVTEWSVLFQLFIVLFCTAKSVKWGELVFNLHASCDHQSFSGSAHAFSFEDAALAVPQINSITHASKIKVK